ncbi:MAG: hypothetical protein KAR11_05350 [Phycisphaerae bacterium]|nr:hypothetical protein [Phycisphaerae bacterium]
MAPKAIQLNIYHMSIPMRGFDHAAATRNTAESIITQLRYDDGFVGYGETLPRDYVTGETLQSVPDDIAAIWDAMDKDSLSPGAPVADLPAIENRCTNAAACGIELAGLRRIFHDLHNIPTELLQKIANRPRMRAFIDAKVSGVLGSKDPRKTVWRLRLMRWFGLTDFKLKLGLGDEIDRQNLQIVHRKLRGGLRRGECTLRVDVNGGWDMATTPERIDELQQYGICVVEQPVYCSAGELGELSQKCSLPLMADESILTEQDAHALLNAPKPIWWNLRISKNGGIVPTLKLMNLAARREIPFTLGCMVGESSILSAAQRRVLQLGPFPRFVEGNYGRYLLADDLLQGRKSLRFGYGGSLRTLKDDGLGIEISQEKLDKYAQHLKTLSG